MNTNQPTRPIDPEIDMLTDEELEATKQPMATNDLRALVKEAIAEALDLSPHSDTIDACSHRDPFEAYHMGFNDCREAVEAALEAQSVQSAYNPGETLSNGAQAGMVCVGWQWNDARDKLGWLELHLPPHKNPRPEPHMKYRRIYAGPVEGGHDVR